MSELLHKVRGNLSDWKYALMYVSIFAVAVFSIFSVLSAKDDTQIHTKRDGLIVTDKSGGSYLIKYKFMGYYIVYDFDPTLMKVRDK